MPLRRWLMLWRYRLACFLVGMLVGVVCAGNDLIRVSDLSQVVYIRQRVDLLNHVEQAALVFLPDLGNSTGFVIHIAKYDCAGWTCLRTS